MKITTGTLQNVSIFSSRESLLSANSKLIAHLQDRLKAKRWRPQEGDSLKLGYMRVFLQALQVQNSILKDQEIEDLKQRLEVLEAMQAGTPAEEQVYGSDFESQGPGIGAGNISEI